jgi:hypothetical protein
MLFNFSIFFTSLIFFIALEWVAFQNDWVFFLAGLIAFLTIQAAKRIGKSFSSGITPLIFAISSVATLYLVDSMRQRQLVIFLSSSVYYLAFLSVYRLRYYERDKTAQGMMSFVSMATIFLFYASMYGIYLNFVIPIGVFMIAYCAVTILLSYQYFMSLDKTDKRRARMYSLVLGLALSEIAWVVNFWPFGYLTTGVVVLMFYYILWYLVQSYFVKMLSKKRLLVHLLLFSFLIGMVLISTRWLPVT